ncbi:hypothetical protein J2T60_000272 [Natronospira proteinivora]|uniref:Uncharacterized protein n=1 Tax=Natronospira proteinivora TaxID=1807133 RepID=A0ABT1G8M5_9GAMM|nr:hypothetical protein [Natronospira proteinivora]
MNWIYSISWIALIRGRQFKFSSAKLMGTKKPTVGNSGLLANLVVGLSARAKDGPGRVFRKRGRIAE